MGPHIVVCIKAVVIKASRGRTVRVPDNVRLNPFDLPAIESALQLKACIGGGVTALSMGPPSSRSVLAEALAMGVDRAVLACDPCLAGADTLATSTTLAAVKAAKELCVAVSVDLNYRARLWSERDARAVMTQIAEQADILFTTEEDTARVFGIRETSYDDVARRLGRQFDLRVVVITLRETPSVWHNTWSAVAYDAELDEICRGPRYDIEVVDRIGAGDSFAGGFLYGYLTSGTKAGLRYGTALSALKQTMPGDIVYASREDVERLLQSGDLRIQR